MLKRISLIRYFVCVMCTLASIFLFIAFHSIIRNPTVTGIDYAIIIVIIVALYIENQVRAFLGL